MDDSHVVPAATGNKNLVTTDAPSCHLYFEVVLDNGALGVGLPYRVDSGSGLFEGETDRKGRFRVDAVPADDYLVEIDGKRMHLTSFSRREAARRVMLLDYIVADNPVDSIEGGRERGLTATLLSPAPKRPANTARATDVIKLVFSEPPMTATDVQVDIFNGGTKKKLASIYGEFNGGVFHPRTAMGTVFVSTKENMGNLDLDKHMLIKLDYGGREPAKIWITDSASQSGITLENRLKLSVTGNIPGKGQQAFGGRSLLTVFYPQAMIVPSGKAKTDPALNIIKKWAKQWQAANKEFRTVIELPIIVPPSLRSKPRSIEPADYDALVHAVTKAIAAAPNGIIALAVGHGDGGFDPDYVAWCDLVAEDAHDRNDRYPHDLYIDDLMLGDGAGEPRANGVKNTPEGLTPVRLNGLDRMADAMKPAAGSDNPPLRKLLLHTCNTGNSKDFMRRMANRLRVRLQAHTKAIVYTGDVQGSIEASYAHKQQASDEQEPPSNPEALREWPTQHVSKEFIPSASAPQRYTP